MEATQQTLSDKPWLLGVRLRKLSVATRKPW